MHDDDDDMECEEEELKGPEADLFFEVDGNRYRLSEGDLNHVVLLIKDRPFHKLELADSMADHTANFVFPILSEQ